MILRNFFSCELLPNPSKNWKLSILTILALLEISYRSESGTPKMRGFMQELMAPASEDRRVDDTWHFCLKGAHEFPAL